jgi:hypothetical protein
LPSPDGPGTVVDVVHAKAADLQAGHCVHQAQDPEQGFVRVSVRAGRPAAEQFALPFQQDGLAGEPGRLPGGQSAGRVDEHDLLGPGEAEELAEHRQTALAGLGQSDQERLDVLHAGQRPVTFT